MRLLTIEALRKADDTVETGNISVSNQEIRIVTPPIPRISGQALNGQNQNVRTMFELCVALEIQYKDLDLTAQLVNLNYVRQTRADKR